MTTLLDRCPRWYLPKRQEAAVCAVSGGLDSMCLLVLLDQWCRETGARLTAAHFNHRLRGAPKRQEAAVCAVSGGLDSMCLLVLLDQWCRETGARLTAAHFNHRLRGAESDRDEAFVRDWCAARGVDFVSGSADVAALAAETGWTVEEAARNARYAFLRQTAKALGPSTRIYTAHHADDNAETVLLNLLRGTGLTGLRGIPPQREGIFRPLLQVRREELAAFAAKNRIPHVEDATNADADAAARNYLRLEILPRLRTLNPRAAEHIADAAARLWELDAGLEDLTERYLRRVSVQPGRVTARLGDLAEIPEFLLPRVLLGMLDLLGAGRKDVGAVHLEAIRRLWAHHGNDARISLPHGVTLPRVLLGMLDLLGAGRKDVGAVHLEAIRRLWAHHGNDARISLPHGVTARLAASRLMLETLPQPLSRAELVKDCPLRWGDYTLTLMDRREGRGLALAPGPDWETVTVAPCDPAERLILPETHDGGRTVKRLCLDRHISLAERDRLPAIYVENRLAAVWRLGVHTEFLPEGEACRFIQINETEENSQ